jgi:predicted kinase
MCRSFVSVDALSSTPDDLAEHDVLADGGLSGSDRVDTSSKAFIARVRDLLGQDEVVGTPGTVHAIHGYLAAGKTTFAHELEAQTGGVVISLDEWTIRLSGDDVRLDPDLFDRVCSLLNELWPRIACAGVDVILDFGFWSRASRDDLRTRAAQVGVPVRLYSLECRDSTALARLRSRPRGMTYVLDADGYTALRDKFEPLCPDEHGETITTDPE